jgi:hypothetical protein
MGSTRRNAFILVSALLCACIVGAVAAASTNAAPRARSRALAARQVARLLPGEAATIAGSLWTEREGALTDLNAEGIAHVESASAERQDQAYIRSVRCRCEQEQAQYPAVRVVVQVPTRSVQPVFFAQIQTTNETTGELVWYVVAIERSGGRWKIAHAVRGGSTVTPPLSKLTNSAGQPPALGAGSYTRVQHLAQAVIRYVSTHEKLTDRTSYGATIRSRYTLEPTDGIYGLALPSGKILSCFTLHRIDTYSHPNGLVQSTARNQWGHQLAPGVYRSIRTDDAESLCRTGTGIGSSPGVAGFSYDSRTLTVTGVR